MNRMFQSADGTLINVGALGERIALSSNHPLVRVELSREEVELILAAKRTEAGDRLFVANGFTTIHAADEPEFKELLKEALDLIT